MSIDLGHLIDLMQGLHEKASRDIGEKGPVVLALSHSLSSLYGVNNAALPNGFIPFFERFAADRQLDPRTYLFPSFTAISQKPMLINEGLLFEKMRAVAAMHQELHGVQVAIPTVIEHFTGITNAVAFRLAGGDTAVIFDSGLVDFILGTIDGVLDLLMPVEPESGLVAAVLEPQTIRDKIGSDEDAMWLLSSNLLACLSLGTALCAIKKKYSPQLSPIRNMLADQILTWVVAHEFAHVACGHVLDPDHALHENASRIADIPKDHLFEHQADTIALEQCMAFARQQGLSEDVPLQAVSWFMCAIQLLDFLRSDPRQPASASATHPLPLKRLAHLFLSFPYLCLRQSAIEASDVPEMSEKLKALLRMTAESTMEMSKVLLAFHPIHRSPPD